MPKLIDIDSDDEGGDIFASSVTKMQVSHKSNKKGQHGVARVSFDVPDMVEEDFKPTKVSFVPQLPSQEQRIKTQNKYKKWHMNCTRR